MGGLNSPPLAPRRDLREVKPGGRPPPPDAPGFLTRGRIAAECRLIDTLVALLEATVPLPLILSEYFSNAHDPLSRGDADGCDGTAGRPFVTLSV